MSLKLDEVRTFWNTESCGERYASGITKENFYKSETANRYHLEPYIKDFAEFEKFMGKSVLEIGVGMGSDHSQIANNNPFSLTGIDLTSRAVEHTKERFETLGLKSNLMISNAENLSFPSDSFDKIYSWGVLHHSPNTEKCFNEVWRVLKKGGEAKIMVYYKYSPVGWMLWLRYGLFKLKPNISLATIYSKYLESPGTKAYTFSEAKFLVSKFRNSNFKVQLSHSDLLIGDVGSRHKGLLLSVAKIFYPKFLVKLVSKFVPIGLFLLISLKK